jgi:hypothetical protein
MHGDEIKMAYSCFVTSGGGLVLALEQHAVENNWAKQDGVIKRESLID